MSSTLLNIAIVPPKHVADAVVGLASRLPEDALLRVDGTRFMAHATVFMARFPDDREQFVVDAVQQVVASCRAVDMHHVGFNLTAGRYYEVSYERTKRLMTLHRAMTKAVAGLRYHPGQPVQETYFEPYSADQRRRAEKTGYDLAGRLYRPHITIGRVPPGDREPVFASTDLALSFRAERLGVFRADENGAARELVRAVDMTVD
jgi:2'-5' RNA ligase